MTSEEEIFERALDFESESEQRAYLAGVCGDDEDLRDAVAELLAAHSEADKNDFLPAPADLATHEVHIREEEGSIIGRYKLLQKIGEGGFGVVYMADQREPVKRRVALKIIKLGMDTKHVVARFEAERQALAMMDHPNIAKVLDGGATKNGRPYFVMELVRGIPVTNYCDENQLTMEDRLRLFLDICTAVTHAHQKGVIHRDLKPSNILVALGDGNKHHPKVIDFGIAKATQHELTDKTLFTRFEDFVGTPAYMSPEQAQYSQLDLDTRTDIYSLGVLLYELLTGRPPFDSKDFLNSAVDEIRRRIREDEPPRPSTKLSSLEPADQTIIAQHRKADPEALQRKLRREIDWIIMRAMEKDRNRRYGTAEALAQDIECYLNGETVEACPPTATYRFKKLVQKNKGTFTIVGAVFAALAIGAIVSVWQALRVSAANERATQLLYHSYQVQAHAMRRTNEPGRHYQSLAVLHRAAEIQGKVGPHSSVELRNHAIATLPLPDVRLQTSLEMPLVPDNASAIGGLGRVYARGTVKGEVSVFRVSDRSEVAEIPPVAASVGVMLFSGNERYLAIFRRLQGPDTLQIWDLQENAELMSIGNVKEGSYHFSQDSRQIAVGVLGAKRKIAIYDLESTEQTAEIPYPRVPGQIRFNEEGTRVAITSSSATPSTDVLVYDTASGEQVAQLRHTRHLKCVAWHPDGNLIAAGGSDFNIPIWKLSTKAKVNELRGHNAEVVTLDFHPEGLYLVSSSWDKTSRIWEHYKGRCVLKWPGAAERFIQNGKALALDLKFEGAGIWTFTTGSSCFTHFHLEGETHHKIVDLSFSPDSQWLAGGASNLRLWDMRTKKLIAASDEIRDPRRIQFERDGRTLLVGGRSEGITRVRIQSSDEPGMLLFDREQSLLKSAVGRFAATGDSQTVAAFVDRSNQVEILDGRTGNRRALLKAQPGIDDLSFGPRGRWLASSSWHGAGVRVWDLNKKEAPAIDLQTNERTTSTGFSPDGRYLAVATRAGFTFWRTGTWEEARYVKKTVMGSTGKIFAFHPTAPLIALSLDGSQIHLLDLESNSYLAEFQAPTPGELANLTFSPDGKQLAAATMIRDVYVWNLPLLREELAKMDLDWE